MFRGLVVVTCDAKQQIILPDNWVQLLQVDQESQSLVFTLDPEQRCLWLYPLEEWEELEHKLRKLPLLHPLSKRLQRVLLGYAELVTLEADRSLIIPKHLKELVELESKVVLVGQGHYWELWDENRWERARGEWLELGLEVIDREQLPAELQHFFV